MRRVIRSLMPGRLLRNEGGASVAEFAVIVPFFLIFLLGVFEFARGLWVVNTLQFAVEQGARYAMLSELNGVSRPTTDNCSTTKDAFATQIQNLVQANLSEALLNSATPSVSITCPSSGSLPVMITSITASYSFSFWLRALVPYGPLDLQQADVVTTPLT